MKNTHEHYALGLKLGHAALLRNLDRFIAIAGRGSPVDAEDLAAFVRLHVDFLDLHHRSEDDFVFPALRRHSAGRTTDAAHLDRWSAEHRDIGPLGHELSRVAGSLAGGGEALHGLARTSRALRDLLVPHLAAEEEILTPAHLPEMIPAEELSAATEAIGRANRSSGVAMASFLACSLDPAEQRALFGETPWLFRKLVLGFLGERRMRRFRAFVHTQSIAV